MRYQPTPGSRPPAAPSRKNGVYSTKTSRKKTRGDERRDALMVLLLPTSADRLVCTGALLSCVTPRAARAKIAALQATHCAGSGSI